jgi:hypothetical protein
MRVAAVVFIALGSLSGCAYTPPAQEAERPKDTFIAGIGLVNHTDRYIYTTSVDGEWGGHAHQMSAGIASMCCVTLPRTWRPGLTVRVGWDMPEGTTHGRRVRAFLSRRRGARGGDDVGWRQS